MFRLNETRANEIKKNSHDISKFKILDILFIYRTLFPCSFTLFHLLDSGCSSLFQQILNKSSLKLRGSFPSSLLIRKVICLFQCNNLFFYFLNLFCFVLVFLYLLLSRSQSDIFLNTFSFIQKKYDTWTWRQGVTWNILQNILSKFG